jgi:hypothetical protein
MSRTQKPTINTKGETPAERTYVLSQDPNRAIREMMETIDALRGVMVQETAALDQTDTEAFFALQDKKLEIARDYQAGMTQLLARKEELRAADPALKSRLETMQRHFHATTLENRNSLDRMRKGMSRLGDRIMSFARKAAEKETRLVYGATGQMQNGGKASMGINESV